VNRAKQIILALSVCGTAAFVVSVAWLVEPDPVYGGKKLSDWAERYRMSFCPVDGNPDGNPPEDSAVRREAVQAALHLRAKILPRALKLIVYEKPDWCGRMERVLEGVNVRRWCPTCLWSPFYGDKGEDCLVYFEMLGPEARTAVPELVRIMKQARSLRIRERAMYALGCTGKEGLPSLMEVLADPENPDRRRAAFAIGDMKNQGTVASPAVPLIVNRLKDADSDVSSAAVIVLGDLALEPDVAVPALTNCLQSTNDYFREEALAALGKFGNNADSAVPLLMNMLDDPDVHLRGLVRDALLEIAPDELRKEEQVKISRRNFLHHEN
jgi:HEAT repeat protein